MVVKLIGFHVRKNLHMELTLSVFSMVFKSDLYVSTCHFTWKKEEKVTTTTTTTATTTLDGRPLLVEPVSLKNLLHAVFFFLPHPFFFPPKRDSL